MAILEDNVRVTLTLSRRLMEQLDELAESRKSTRERELQWMIEDRVRRQLEVREHFERLSEMYRARLDREERLNQSEEEIMEDLRRIREQVANELHPD